jgi:hypothetical protein
MLTDAFLLNKERNATLDGLLWHEIRDGESFLQELKLEDDAMPRIATKVSRVLIYDYMSSLSHVL